MFTKKWKGRGIAGAVALSLVVFLSSPVRGAQASAGVFDGQPGLFRHYLSLGVKAALEGAQALPGEAQALPVTCLSLSGQALPQALSGQSRYQSYTPVPGDALTVENAGGVGWLYVEFAQTPGPYAVVAGGVVLPAGSNGFLHEVISLPAGCTRATVLLPGQAVCNITAYGPGALPAGVQRWQPAAGACDMLIFPTHADDDVLYFGPMAAVSAARGYEVQVAYLVNHWAVKDRPHELLDGLWEMGLRRYPVIGTQPDMYTMSLDSARAMYDSDKLQAYEVEQIRRFQPAVVVGHDLAGEYGHGAHMLGANLLPGAVEAAASAEMYPESAARWGTWAVEKLYLHNYRKGEVVLDVRTPMDILQSKTPFALAEDAYAKHVSQQIWGDLAVVDYGVADCRRFGLYYSAVGPDTLTGYDALFEHTEAQP